MAAKQRVGSDYILGLVKILLRFVQCLKSTPTAVVIDQVRSVLEKDGFERLESRDFDRAIYGA